VNLDLDNSGGYGDWHCIFRRVPDLPELLFPAHERVIVLWFLTRSAQDWRATFSDADVGEYVRAYSHPTSRRGMLECYRAAPRNAIRNREVARPTRGGGVRGQSPARQPRGPRARPGATDARVDRDRV
jgi:hypothetical protein